MSSLFSKTANLRSLYVCSSLKLIVDTRKNTQHGSEEQEAGQAEEEVNQIHRQQEDRVCRDRR
jgi:hypothetical protein